MADRSLTQAEKQKLAIITLAISREFTNGAAAKQLGVSVRQIQRLKKDVQEHGEKAVVHKLKGKVGNHHIDSQVKLQVIEEIKTKYSDFKPKFATEKLQETLPVVPTSQTVRVWMTEANLWKTKHLRQVKYYSFRGRKDYVGELIQFDGSYHYWFEGRLVDEFGNPIEVCLLASIDDATSQVIKAQFALNEGIEAVFTFWREYVRVIGRPISLYLDKYSTYKVNHKNAVDNSELLTQFQKAMKILSIQIIPANSPQAKGRIERLFQTLQDRLVKELRLANISTIENANQFLDEVFIPKFNMQFSVTPAKIGDIHRALISAGKEKLDSIFSIKSTRQINNDFTIQFKNYFYQLEEIQPITIRPRDKVLVEEWLDHSLHFYFRGQYLNYFVLSARPKKVINQPAILTTHPLNWKPPANHPWRQYKQKLNSGG